MMLRKKIYAGVTVALLAVLAMVTPATAATASGVTNSDTNHADYWEAQYPGATCVKYEDAGSTAHGTEYATGVTLKDVAGKNYVTLIVKGGQNDYKEYVSPATGLAYSTPQNNNGKAAGLSHWIVCFKDTPTVDKCYETQSYMEYQYSRLIPGKAEEKHTEYRYQTRIYRPSQTVERKFVKGYDFVSGGSVTFRGNDGQQKTVSGHWVASTGWHQIPDSVINAYWGSGGITSSLLGGTEANPKGNVPLSTYGGPNASVPYYASEISISGSYTDWGPWSAWSTTDPGTDTAVRQSESKVVVTQQFVADVTEYYVDGDSPSLQASDATWVETDPGSDWTVYDDRDRDRQVEVSCVDVCPNIDGNQATVPADLVKIGENCVTEPPPVYLCIAGDKVRVDADDTRIQDGIPWTDECGKIIVVPTCDSITVTWPKVFDGQHINAEFQELDKDGMPVGGKTQVNRHWDTNSTDNAATHTLLFKQAASWPGWTHFRITFIQANENDTWPDLDCGDTYVKICDFDDLTKTWGPSDLIAASTLQPGFKEYVSNADCGQDWVQVCEYNDQTHTWGASALMDPSTVGDGKLWTGNTSDCITYVSVCEFDSQSGTWVESDQFDSKLKDPEDGLFSEGCGPDYVQVCVSGDNGWGPSGWMAAAPAGSKAWTGDAVDCYPPVALCVPGDGADVPNTRMLLTERQYRDGDYSAYNTWAGDVEGSGGCTPPTLEGSAAVGMCQSGVPYLDWTVTLKDPDGNASQDGFATITFVHPGADRSLDVSYTVDLDEGIGNDLLLWPGASEDGGVGTGWPGWAKADDGSWVSVGDGNYGWTRDGVTVRITVDPELVLTVNYPQESPECDSPPTTICSAAGNGGWEQTTIQVADLKTTDKEWDDSMEDGGCADPQEPTLNGSFVGGECAADAPWLRYDVQLNDPDDQSTDDGYATITFVNPNEGGEDYVTRVPIGSGYVLWPGASVEPGAGYTVDQIDPSNPDSFEATGWPGWKLEDDEWVYSPDQNYGWTRSGVDIVTQVNTEFTVNVAYPPSTPTCVPGPQEITAVLGAPPLDDEVVAVATYAG